MRILRILLIFIPIIFASSANSQNIWEDPFHESNLSICIYKPFLRNSHIYLDNRSIYLADLTSSNNIEYKYDLNNDIGLYIAINSSIVQYDLSYYKESGLKTPINELNFALGNLYLGVGYKISSLPLYGVTGIYLPLDKSPGHMEERVGILSDFGSVERTLNIEFAFSTSLIHDYRIAELSTIRYAVKATMINYNDSENDFISLYLTAQYWKYFRHVSYFGGFYVNQIFNSFAHKLIAERGYFLKTGFILNNRSLRPSLYVEYPLNDDLSFYMDIIVGAKLDIDL